MTKKELIAEITSDFRQYDEAGLIDYRSLNLWIKNAVKRFGNNIMVPSEKIIIIENGKAKLPENFWLLTAAAKCEDAGYKVCEGSKEHILMTHTYKQRLEQSFEWDNNAEDYFKGDYKLITEKVFFNTSSVEFNYYNPQILRLTKGMKRNVCHSSCKNLEGIFSDSCPYEINITGEYIQTNFATGYIYMQYLALPSDDEGDIIIPETQHNHLQNYVMYHCKAKILENIIANEDDPGKGQLLQYFSAKEREMFPLAMTESKFEGLGAGWDARLKNKMRKDTYKYELMFPNK